MKRCKYCGRYMRNRVSACHSCGSEKFGDIESDKIITIEAPKEGFHVSTKKLEESKAKWKKSLIIGIISTLYYPLFLIGFKYPLFLILYFYFGIPLFFITLTLIIAGIWGTIYYSKEIRRINKLKTDGILVKNQHYKISRVGNNYYTCDVSFRIDNQSKAIPLKSNRLFATEFFYDDGLVDVLINPNDYQDYFISFDIY